LCPSNKDEDYKSTTRTPTKRHEELELVEVLQRENEQPRQETVWLRERIDQLALLALPWPRRGGRLEVHSGFQEENTGGNE